MVTRYYYTEKCVVTIVNYDKFFGNYLFYHNINPVQFQILCINHPIFHIINIALHRW